MPDVKFSWQPCYLDLIYLCISNALFILKVITHRYRRASSGECFTVAFDSNTHCAYVVQFHDCSSSSLCEWGWAWKDAGINNKIDLCVLFYLNNKFHMLKTVLFTISSNIWLNNYICHQRKHQHYNNTLCNNASGHFANCVLCFEYCFNLYLILRFLKNDVVSNVYL